MAKRLGTYTIASLFMISLCPAAVSSDENYGYLDFSRLNKREEQQFFRRLGFLAFDEAVLMRCDQPDNFATRAWEAIRARVTKEVLDRAEKYFVESLHGWSAALEQNKQSCLPVKVVSRTSLGIHIKAVTRVSNSNDLHGVQVVDVMPFLPAAAAGMRAGDLITRINETAVSNSNELLGVLTHPSPSSIAKVGIERDGTEIALSVKLTTLTIGPDGQLASDGAKLVATGHQELDGVVSEIDKLCQYCKYSIFRPFCR